MKADDDKREREFAALDGLLDDLPEPVAPTGLAERVLAATAAERAAAGVPAGPSRWVVWGGGLLSAAAGVALWMGVQTLFGGGASEGDVEPRVAQADPTGQVVPTGQVDTTVAPEQPQLAEPDWIEADDAPAPELLAELELLEDWELLVTDDLDLLLAELDELDEVLLDLEQDDAEDEQG